MRLLAALMVTMALLVGCGSPAPAWPGGAPGGAPAPGSGPAAGGASSGGGVATADGLRQQVIEGARREGQVNALIQSTWTGDGLRALEQGIEREYGVRLKINHTPVANYQQRAATLITELQANVTPSFDVYQSSNTSSRLMLEADALEAVDWAALLPSGTPAGVVRGEARLLVIYTDQFGALYDPTAVPEVPRSLKDLGDPKWRGRFMVNFTPTVYIPHILLQGREEFLAAIRAAARNGAVPDSYANQYARFAAREYALVLVSSSYYNTAQKQGLPARFAPLDFLQAGTHHVSVARKAAHPNAARLLAAFLAGPEGQRIAEQDFGAGNIYYETSSEYKLAEEARAAGVPTFFWIERPDALEYPMTPHGEETLREVELILKGG